MSGNIGAAVVIYGSGFNPTVNGNIVCFGPVKATVIAASANTLTVNVPPGAGYGFMTVTTSYLTAYSSRRFTTVFPGGTGLDLNSFDSRVDFPVGNNSINTNTNDFDGDGKIDIANIGWPNAFQAILKNSSVGGIISFTSAFSASIFNSREVCSGDLTGDGQPDLVYCNSGNDSITIFTNTSLAGNVSFINNGRFQSGDGPTALAIRDIDIDGKPDIVIGNTNAGGSISILRNTSSNNTVSFEPKIDISCPVSYLTVDDMDGDGKADLIASGDYTLSLYRNISTTGNIMFAVPVTFNIEKARLSTGDLDGDGKPEIVMSVTSTSVLSLFRNNSSPGNISMTQQANLVTSGFPDGVQIGDLDGDGNADLATTGTNSGFVSLFRNTSISGSLSFGPRIDYPMPTIRSINLADLDNDGKTDLLVSGSSFVSLFRNRITEPLITSLSPASGGSGSMVVINGSNFNATSAVNFGGLPAQSFTINSATKITAVVGAGNSGKVTVTTALGSGSIDGFNWYPPPTLTSFSPSLSGPNVTISLTGTNLQATTGVTFGGVAATSFTIESDVLVRTVTGPGSTGDVVINTTHGSASQPGYTFYPAPIISSFSPSSSTTGGVVTIKGNHFTGVNMVSFGGTLASSYTLVSDTVVTAVVGPGSSGAILLRTPGGIGGKSGFVFVAPPPVPSINSFTPVSCGSGTTVVINGSGFTNASAVSFGGTPALSFSVISSTTINAVVDTGSTGSLSVTTLGGTAVQTGFIFVHKPIITSFNPSSAAQGNTVIINGAYLNNLSAVKFGGVNAGSFTVLSANSITAVVANGASGNVAVTSAGGKDSLPGFLFAPSPTITSFLPTVGVSGTVITIKGMGFLAANAVKFGTVPATSFTVLSDTLITAVVNTGSSGNVSVSSVYGTATKGGFTFNPPVITSFSPAAGPIGTTVTISGNNFSSVAANNIVFFGAVKATVISSSSTSIKVTVPAGASYKPVSVNVNYLTAYCSKPFIITFDNGVVNTASFTNLFDSTAANAGTQKIAMVDLDGDGRPDIITSNANSGISVYRNIGVTGLASFAPRLDFNTNLHAMGLELTDFSGDGKPDVIITSSSTGIVAVLRNTSTVGNISFAAASTFGLGSNGNFVTSSDIDGDSRPDLVTANSGTNAINIYRNGSSGGNIAVADSTFLITVSPNTGIALSDLTGDKLPEMIRVNGSTNNLSIYRNMSMAGAVSFNAPDDFQLSSPGRCVQVADLNADNKPELIIGTTTDSIIVMENTSSGNILSFMPHIFKIGATASAPQYC